MSEVLTVWAPIIILVAMSGLFSGLTLGLLSLDIKQLENVIRGGDESEQKWATRILPTRRFGNWLLCTLLLGNVAVNAMLSIILADMTSGLMGFLLSTALIVIFGEILPQACCSRYGLAIGYYTVPIVWVIMAVLAPMAWPISWVLDQALGAEMGQIYTRSMFKHLIMQHAEETQADFDVDETAIMCSVLELKDKMVADIMTPLEKVFAIEYNTKLDFEQLEKLMECCHSRIPVFHKELTKDIVGLLYVKDLVLLNPEDGLSVSDILLYSNHLPLHVEISEMNCTQLLQRILEGSCHMAVCREVVEDPDGGDNLYQNIGIVTLEDLIAQLLGKHEPEEVPALKGVTPTSTRAASSAEDKAKTQLKNYIEMFRRKRVRNSLQQNEVALAVQILLNKVPEFVEVPRCALKELIGQVAVCQMEPGEQLYQSGEPTSAFTLLLEGHVEINCGKENFLSEIGPWTPIGIGALSEVQESYVPDFSARPRQGGPGIKYIQISSEQYQQLVHKPPGNDTTTNPLND